MALGLGLSRGGGGLGLGQGAGRSPSGPSYAQFSQMTGAQLVSWLAARGLVFTRASTALYTLDGTTWAEAASGVPRLHMAQDTGRRGFLPEAAATNALVYSNDLSNAAWTKSNITAAQTATGLKGDAFGATRLTATAANATVRQNISSSSALRTPSGYARRVSGSSPVWLGTGVPTGAAKYSDAFASDTSGEWVRGADSIDGVAAVVAGVLTYTKGVGDGSYPRILRAVTGVTPGKFYRITGTIGGTASVKYLGLPNVADGGFTTADARVAGSGELSVVYQALTTTVYACIALDITATVGQTVTLDDVSVYEVAETQLDLTSTSQWRMVEQAAAMIINPVITIRMEGSGDVVEIGNVQCEVGQCATTPILTGASAGAGAADFAIKTGINVNSCDLEFEALSPVAPSSSGSRLFGVFTDDVTEAYRLLDVYQSGANIGNFGFNNSVAAQNLVRPAATGVSHRVRASASNSPSAATLTVDGSATSGVAGVAPPAAATRFILGAFGSSAILQWSAPIYYVRDYSGGVLS